MYSLLPPMSVPGTPKPPNLAGLVCTFLLATTSFSTFSRRPRGAYVPSPSCSMTPRKVPSIEPGLVLRFIGLEYMKPFGVRLPRTFLSRSFTCILCGSSYWSLPPLKSVLNSSGPYPTAFAVWPFLPGVVRNCRWPFDTPCVPVKTGS